MRAVVRKPAFTLVELLVVIAIIALLISILLPALGRAREQGRAAVCLSNVKQVSAGFFLYAEDNRSHIPGTYWQGPINLDWGGRNNARYISNPNRYRHPIQASAMGRYIADVDKILECPSAQRRANRYFDYTVIIRLAGARTDLPWFMTWRERPGQATSEKRFTAIPLLVEEDEIFYNASVDDGSFANLDQFTDRHNGGGNMSYLNGSAGRFKSPKGPNPRIEEAGRDMTCRDLRLLVGTAKYGVWGSSATEFGWVNRPRGATEP